MSKKLVLSFTFLLFLIISVLLLINNNSYAIMENQINIVESYNINLDLKYDETSNFEDTVLKYIDTIDNYLIPTTSFMMSDTLNNNYDFLTIFAINFIINNEDTYKDSIIIGEEYVYKDDYGKKFITNKYVSKDVIYNITYNVFGKRYYQIINEYLEDKENIIPLLLIRNYDFNCEIDKIVDMVKYSKEVSVSVKYKNNDTIYKYIFEFLNDDKLVIKNLEIEVSS